MKKMVLIIAAIAVVFAIIYLMGSGFIKNGTVYIDEYVVSDDGEEITINIGVASSVGYIRKLAIHQQEGGKMYIDCYGAFGGINGSIGAKAVYTLPLNEDTTMIALYRNTNAYEEVLKRDVDGVWQRVR